MTAATNKALSLYPEPQDWQPAVGVNTERMTPDQVILHNRALFLRSSLMSDEWPRMVRAFRTVMRLDLPHVPMALPAAEKEHHASLLASEVHEFATATDLIEQADGLLDVIYVAVGALCHMGLSDNQILAGFTEVHASNMTKVQDNGTPLINDGEINASEPIGKVLKTHNYVRPDLASAMSIEP